MTETEILDQIQPWKGLVPRGYWINWLGAKSSVVFHAHWMSHELMQSIMAGERYETTRRPVFGDGEFYFEQLNTIKSILDASKRYILVELGAGIGPRAVDSALALQKLRPNLEPFLVAVEALPTYVEWCKVHFRTNGLDPNDHWIVTGFVSTETIPQPFYLQPKGFGNQVADPSVVEALTNAAKDVVTANDLLRHLTARGVVLDRDKIIEGWPRAPIDINGFEGWSLEKIVEVGCSLSKPAEIGFVNAVTVETILAPLLHVDLMDVDIQFAEEKVIPQSLGLLRKKVKLLNIGTHGHDIHSELVALFREAGWNIVFDIGPFGTYSRDGMEFTSGDGVLTVQNPDLIG
jgi:hypothetical protein